MRSRHDGARGTLADQPVVKWLIAALDSHTNATMCLSSGQGEFRLHVRDGVLVAMQSPDEDRWSDQPLLRATAIFALPPETPVDVCLAESFDERHRLKVSPLVLITRGLRALAGSVKPQEILGALDGMSLMVRPNAPVRRLGLLRFEMQVVDALRGRRHSLAELTALRLVHPRALAATLYVLNELRFLEGPAAQPIGADRNEVGAPSVRRDPSPPKRAVRADMPTPTDLEARLRAMASESYFEMLGVGLAASRTEIDGALAKLLFHFHPDRLPPSSRRIATLICARLSGAARHLNDVDLRAQHIEDCGLSTEPVRTEPNHLEEVLREAEHRVRVKDSREAESMLLRALDAHPNEPDLTALLAWAQADAMGGTPCGIDERTNRYNPQLRMLRSVVNDHPRNVRARDYFARLLKRSGRFEAAMRQFEILVELEPQNIDAARELRLFVMREKNAQQAGMLSRLLKR